MSKFQKGNSLKIYVLQERGDRVKGTDSFGNDLAGCFDVLLPSHKNKDVPWRVREVYREGLLDGSLDIVFYGHLGIVLFNVKGPSRNTKNGHTTKEIRKAVCIQCGGGDDKLQIASTSDHFL